MFQILGSEKHASHHARIPAAPKGRRRVRLQPFLEVLEQRLALSNVSGNWQGTLYQPSGGPTTSYNLEMNLTQSGDSVQGTEQISTGSYYADINLSGTVDETTDVFNFQESSISQQNPPPGYYWLIKSGSLQISADGNSMSGPWSPSSGGTIDLSRVSAPTTTTDITSSSNPSVFGQPVTFTTTVTAAMSSSGPPTGTVTFTIDGTVQPAVMLTGDSAPFSISTLTVTGSPHAVSATYNPDTANFSTSTGTLDGGQTVSPATPTVSVSDAGGTSNGMAFPATATVAGVDNTPAASLEGVSPTLTYYAGSTASGTPLSGAPSAAGTYTVMANFAGSADYTSASDMTTFVINEKTLQPVSALTGEAIEQKALQVVADYKARGVTYKLGADASHGGKKSDCTHFVRDVLQQAGLNNPVIPYTTTSQFSTSIYFQLVPTNQARAGDVMVQGIHAGIFTGAFDKKGRPLGAEMGDHGAVAFAPWGPGGWFRKPDTLKYYRPMQLM